MLCTNVLDAALLKHHADTDPFTATSVTKVTPVAVKTVPFFAPCWLRLDFAPCRLRPLSVP